MNYLNFNQSIGFPLETNILDLMQKNWTVYSAFGSIVGNLSIISGCNLVGSTVSDGVVFINGEVFNFKGGLQQTKVIIVETAEALEFEDTSSHDVIYTRYVTFGVATTFFNWSDFKRGFETKEISGALDLKEDKLTVAALVERIEALEDRPISNVPIGSILIWDRPASEIPEGWEEYTPLAGRIPLGKSSSGEFSVLGNLGGNSTHTNTILEMAEHGHDWKFDDEGDDGSSGGSYTEFTTKPGTIPINDGKNPIAKSGSGQPYSIMNPYRIVHFIKYVG